VNEIEPHPEERAPKSGLPDFGTQGRIEIGNSRFRLRASRRMDALHPKSGLPDFGTKVAEIGYS
jgi:hypothetical protein